MSTEKQCATEKLRVMCYSGDLQRTSAWDTGSQVTLRSRSKEVMEEPGDFATKAR